MSNPARRPIVVTYDGGLSFSAQIRSHRLIVDQPLAAGGADAGPAPLELLGTALGTCVAFYVQRFLHARGLPYEGMRVEVEQQKASNPARIGTFIARVVLPTVLPPAQAEMLERVARGCPAHGTLTHAADVRLTIATQAATAAA